MSSRNTRITFGLVVGLTVAAAVTLIAAEQEINAYPGWGTYTKDVQSGNGNDVDPVTLIFWDGSATLGLTHIHNEFAYHTGWGSVSSTDQFFNENGNWQPEDGERASASGGNRYHIRMNQGDDIDPNWRAWTMGTPHYEIYHSYGTSWPPSCWGNHRTTSFVDAREYIVAAFAFHPYAFGVRNNDKPLEQCDGSYVTADDRYRLVEIYYN